MRICRLCRPELRLAGNPLDLADRVQVREVSERQRQQPLGVLAGERSPNTRWTTSKAVMRSPARPIETAASCSRTSRRLPSICACTSVKVRPCPARHSRAAEPLDDVE